MPELKHQQQQRPANRPTRLATMRPQSRPLILLHPSSNTGRGRRNSDVAVGERRRTLEAARAMIIATYARESTNQAIVDQEVR
jgi:hypothetical protein